MNDYDDIIDRTPPKHPCRRPMSMAGRAAQFAPFAALSGHYEAIEETARLTSSRVEQSAEHLEELSRRLVLAMSFSDRPVVEITYFRPDASKSGGAYVAISGSIKSIEPVLNILTFTDNTQIPLDSVSDISSPIFDDL